MPLQPGQPLPTDPDKLDGVVKAAIVLLSLDHDVAGELLKHLPTEMVEEVTRALASLQDVPPELTERVVEEFYSLGMATVHSKQGSGRETWGVNSGPTPSPLPSWSVSITDSRETDDEGTVRTTKV